MTQAEPLPPAVAAEVARQRAILCQGIVETLTPAEFDRKLARSITTRQPLRVKLGVDPTSTALHLGFTVVLNKLRAFQDLGHQAVLIIGDSTAMVGDPTGKNKTRPRLTRADVDHNAASYLEQAGRVLDLARTEVRRNSEWLAKLDFMGVVELAAQTTVARMLEREDFTARHRAGTPIFLHEFLYPLMQGQDSVAIRADVELGGTEQLFNLLMGRELQANAGQEPQICMTTPLLLGLDGVQKMSKSYGNTIGITDDAQDMFGKAMSIPDALVRQWFTLITAVPADEVDRVMAGHPRDAKVALGRALVTRYHDAAAADSAADHFRRVFSEKQAPESMPELVAPAAEIRDDGTHGLIGLIVAGGFVKSTSDARRLIGQGAVSINGEKVTDVKSGRVVVDGDVLRVGKLGFARLKRGN